MARAGPARRTRVSAVFISSRLCRRHGNGAVGVEPDEQDDGGGEPDRRGHEEEVLEVDTLGGAVDVSELAPEEIAEERAGAEDQEVEQALRAGPRIAREFL